MATVLEDRWYRAYWDLKSWQATAQAFGHCGETLVDIVFHHPSRFDNRLRLVRATAAYHSLPFSCPDSFIAEGRRLAKLVTEAVAAGHPKENVYQAAISVIPTWGCGNNHLSGERLFRGESNAGWSTKQFLQSIFRHNPDTEEMRRRKERIDIAAQLFRKRFPDRADSDHEVLAILQHYVLPTWLIDVTTSVYISLFFASGHDNGVGVVYTFSIRELEEYHKMAPELVPPIRFIKPRFVPRIDRQYGLFLDGGHGWFTRHLVREVLQFKQQPGMQFEDPMLGVTNAHLFQIDDDLAKSAHDIQTSLNTIESPKLHAEANGRRTTDLLGASEVDLRTIANAAPKLDVSAPEVPKWPPSEEDLQKWAQRLLQDNQVGDETRRLRAANALAKSFCLLCVDTECASSITSPFTFAQAVQQITFEMERATACVRNLFSFYLSRASTDCDREVVRRAEAHFRQLLGTDKL